MRVSRKKIVTGTEQNLAIHKSNNIYIHKILCILYSLKKLFKNALPRFQYKKIQLQCIIYDINRIKSEETTKIATKDL